MMHHYVSAIVKADCHWAVYRMFLFTKLIIREIIHIHAKRHIKGNILRLVSRYYRLLSFGHSTAVLHEKEEVRPSFILGTCGRAYSLTKARPMCVCFYRFYSSSPLHHEGLTCSHFLSLLLLVWSIDTSVWFWYEDDDVKEIVFN
jgi:hypothetical protein